jgi:hypothetical protein
MLMEGFSMPTVAWRGYLVPRYYLLLLNHKRCSFVNVSITPLQITTLYALQKLFFYSASEKAHSS